MNVLSVSGILPIPGLITSNDFVFHTYRSYREQFPGDKVVIIRTTQYTTNIKKVLRRETELNKINKKYTWNIYDLRVDIFTFLSSRKLRNLHAILAYSILLFNRRKLRLLMNEHRFDIVHAQYIYPDGLLAYFIHKKYHIPYTLTTHNELFYFHHHISRFIGKRILKNAFRILPINFRNVNYFKELGLNNVEILPLGFNKSFIRQQKSSSSATIRIVTVCELIPLKNVDKVLLAITSLINKYDIFIRSLGGVPSFKDYWK
jgi:glycosyltransferase involved in cell wall biosynthesis